MPSTAPTDRVGLGPSIAASAPRPRFHKDNPGLVAAPLAPARPRRMEGTDDVLKAMVGVHGALGGLIDSVGEELGIDPIAMLSVWMVESGGARFIAGQPILRIEIHKLWKYWGAGNPRAFDRHFRFGGHGGVPGKAAKSHAFRTAPDKPWRTIHVGSQDNEYEAFGLAEHLAGREAACLSSSWGGCQVMGFNHAALGYPSASGLAAAFAEDERWHVLGFADFCDGNGCLDEIRDQKWVRFGDIYNGDGAVYGPRIEANFRRRAAFLALPFA